MSVQCPCCGEQLEVDDFNLECKCGTKFVVKVEPIVEEDEEN